VVEFLLTRFGDVPIIGGEAVVPRKIADIFCRTFSGALSGGFGLNRGICVAQLAIRR
jgi:hypothetical protein